MSCALAWRLWWLFWSCWGPRENSLCCKKAINDIFWGERSVCSWECLFIAWILILCQMPPLGHQSYNPFRYIGVTSPFWILHIHGNLCTLWTRGIAWYGWKRNGCALCAPSWLQFVQPSVPQSRNLCLTMIDPIWHDLAIKNLLHCKYWNSSLPFKPFAIVALKHVESIWMHSIIQCWCLQFPASLPDNSFILMETMVTKTTYL